MTPTETQRTKEQQAATLNTYPAHTDKHETIDVGDSEHIALYCTDCQLYAFEWEKIQKEGLPS